MKLLVKRINLDLIDCGGNGVKRHQIREAVGMKITDPNRADFVGSKQLFHCTPRAMNVTVGLVNQIQINVIKL
ncbi:hypothetical protein D3C77_688710 [compost metagenome]